MTCVQFLDSRMSLRLLFQTWLIMLLWQCKHKLAAFARLPPPPPPPSKKKEYACIAGKTRTTWLLWALSVWSVTLCEVVRSLRIQLTPTHDWIYKKIDYNATWNSNRWLIFFQTSGERSKHQSWNVLTVDNILNPLGPKSDQHQFSPNNISRSSRVKVMRITKFITKGRMLWC